MLIAEQVLCSAIFFILFTKLFVCAALFVDLWNLVQSIPAPVIFTFWIFFPESGAASRCFGLCVFATAAFGLQKNFGGLNIMIKKDYFNVSLAVISPDNVQRIAELISLRALKMLCQFPQKAFSHLYKGLIRDVYYPDVYPNHIFSDGYDILQTVICFLCEHMGKRMDTTFLQTRKVIP